MTVIGWIVNGGIIALFAALGVVLLCGKGAFLIAGYNTMSKAEKDAIDEKRLCQFMGKLMLVLAACWCVITLFEVRGPMSLFWVAVAAFLAITFGAVIYANTGNRFKKET